MAAVGCGLLRLPSALSWPTEPMVCVARLGEKMQSTEATYAVHPGQAVYALAHFFAPFIPVAAEVLPLC